MRALWGSLIAVVLAGCAACGPVVTLPGGELSGDVTAPPDDWTAADQEEVVQLETNPADPYSINIWGVGVGRDYYVASGSGGTAQWDEHIAADSAVRLRVGDEVYELRAVDVTDESEITRVRARYMEKYDVEEDDRMGRARLYRLDRR